MRTLYATMHQHIGNAIGRCYSKIVSDIKKLIAFAHAQKLH